MYQYNLFSPKEMKNLENYKNLLDKKRSEFCWGIYFGLNNRIARGKSVEEYFKTEQLSLNLGV